MNQVVENYHGVGIIGCCFFVKEI